MTNWKQTLYLWTFGFLKVPLIFLVRPKVIRLEDDYCEIKIPLNRLTRNHLKSMYFGTLAIGADCAGGIIAMDAIRRTGKKVSIVFKDFQADFLKRPEADTHFICRDGKAIRDCVGKAIQSEERVHYPMTLIATVPTKLGDEPVARFKLTLSLKSLKK